MELDVMPPTQRRAGDGATLQSYGFPYKNARSESEQITFME